MLSFNLAINLWKHNWKTKTASSIQYLNISSRTENGFTTGGRQKSWNLKRPGKDFILSCKPDKMTTLTVITEGLDHGSDKTSLVMLVTIPEANLTCKINVSVNAPLAITNTSVMARDWILKYSTSHFARWDLGLIYSDSHRHKTKDRQDKKRSWIG